ncbi:MAG: DUF4232 domain-containing protein [Actinomycetota bacterium]
MRIRTSTAAAICVLAAGLAAGGCASGSSSSTPVSPSATQPTKASPGPQAGGSPPTAISSPGPQAAGNGGSCHAQNLGFALGAKTPPSGSGQTTLTVDLTNHGSSACTMTGFPGVDLVGLANGQQNYTWSLVRQSASYSKVTLQPGGIAHFGLVYLPAASGDSTDISVVKMVITPPGDFTQAEVTWDQSMLLQDGATHPGTYISPVVPGS